MATGDIPTIAELWAQAVALVADLEADDGPVPDDWSSDYRAEDWDRLWTLERGVLEGPIHSHADAVAKLKGVNLTFERGTRTDGLAEPAMVDAIAWLEANP